MCKASCHLARESKARGRGGSDDGQVITLCRPWRRRHTGRRKLWGGRRRGREAANGWDWGWVQQVADHEWGNCIISVVGPTREHRHKYNASSRLRIPITVVHEEDRGCRCSRGVPRSPFLQTRPTSVGRSNSSPRRRENAKSMMRSGSCWTQPEATCWTLPESL